MLDTLPTTPLQPLNSRTIADAVTARLRTAILSGEFRLGLPLSQEHLAARFGVSRVPIREALRQLANEGLVSLQPHHSAIVSSYTASQMEELVFVAATLDVGAMRRAVPLLSSADVRQMEELLGAMRKCEDRPGEWLLLNLEFHLVPIRAFGWPRLEALVVESRRNLGRFVMPAYPQLLRAWDRQHGDICSACMERDVECAQAALDHHWKYTYEEMAALLDPDNTLAKSASQDDPDAQRKRAA